MSKTRDTGFLGNVVKVDSTGNVSFVSGSTTLMSISSSGAVTTTGVISGSNALSSSYALNADQVDGLNSTSFVFTSSYNTDSSSVSTRVTRIEGNYATTGSNVFLGAQTVCANITSTGTIIAQTLNVQQVTSSVVYSSGSNVFGCSLANTQQFTGSVLVTGSLTVTTAGTSPEFQVAVGGNTLGNALTDVHNVTGSLRITGSVVGLGSTCISGLITGCSSILQVPSTAAVIDILRLNNPAVVSSGTRLKFENGYGDLAALRVIHRDNGSLADDGQIEFQVASNTVLDTKMTILNTGQIGMGTLSPSAELQINKNCDVTLALSNCINVTSGNRGSIAWYNCATSTVANIRATAVTDNVGTQLEFYTRCAGGSLTQNLTISSLGQLFVNTTNWPTCVASNSVNRHIFGGSTEPTIFLWNEATAAANNQSTIWLGAKSATGANYIGGGYIAGGLENATNSCGYLVFRTTDTTAGTNERMRITAAGNIGIGTCSPSSAKVVICGTTEANYFDINALNGSAGLTDSINAMARFINSSDGATVLIKNNNSSRTDAAVFSVWNQTNSRLIILNNGYVGVGCSSPSDPLTVGGGQTGISINSQTTGDSYIRWRKDGTIKADAYLDRTAEDLYLGTSTGAGALRLKTVGNTRMVISSGGNILACGRTSSILGPIGNIQEWVGEFGVINNNSKFNLFCIANQYDNLIVDLFAYINLGSFTTISYRFGIGYNLSNTYTAQIGDGSFICGEESGTQYFETFCWKNCSGSTIQSARVALRIFGYGVGSSVSSGGNDLICTTCLTRIK